MKNTFIVALIFLIFFAISFLTNIMGPLIPDIIRDFHVSLAMAALLPFSFFIAYGAVSIPAGFLVERWGEKPLITASFVASTFGALSFALFHNFAIATLSLFVIGSGMAALQVAINPLLRVAGGESHFAFNSAFAQLIFGLASFVSPFVYSYLVEGISRPPAARDPLLTAAARIAPAGLPWVSIYWLFALISIVMAFAILMVRLPRVERKDDESAGTVGMYRELARKPLVWLYFLAVIAYVGSEQGSADWMSQFLYRYHGVDPHVGGSRAVAYFWGLLTVGCLFGMYLLRLFDSRKVLLAFSTGALVTLTLGLFGSAPIAIVAFPCLGLFASIMWPTLVSLALNSVPKHHGPFAGILCTGIMGGALVPLLIGKVGDAFGLRTGMMALYVTFTVVLSVGLWARPLISNSIR